MSSRVGDLVSDLSSRSRAINVRMGDVELIPDGDEAGMLRVGTEFFPWGDTNTQRLANFLKGPNWKYFPRESLAWQSQVVKHHTDKVADTETLWYIEENTSIAGIYFPDTKIIPLTAVAGEIVDVFDPDDIATVLYSPDQVEINVTSKLKTVTVPGIDGDPTRPLEGTIDWAERGIKVGDISTGGIRVNLQPGKPDRAPSVEEFWERYICTNGMTRKVTGSQINLRGRTVPAVLAEMNKVMRTIWEGLEESARNILHSAETAVPGTVADFLRVVARERGINAATVLRLQERAGALRPNPSVYDVTQIVTDMANEEGLPVLTRRNLQAIGGDLLIHTDTMVHRCNTCERPFANA